MTPHPTTRTSLQPPFIKEHQLNNELDDCSAGATLPSRPLLSLSAPQVLSEFLLRDIVPIKLNRLAPHLWLCSQPSHTNIPPLHLHTIHGRNIIVAEEPDLHLVWSNGRVFIKPLPTYLLSHAFWTHHLLESNTEDTRLVKQAALGLLRSYFYCIRHGSDLRVAQQHHLVPTEITWTQWCHFAATFNTIKNDQVSPRYHYGKLQLNRLHLLVRIYLGGLNYYYIDGGYGESFTRYYGPLLFIFAILSVILSALQVCMAVEQLQSLHWTAFWSASRWFSVISLLISALVALYLVLSFVVKSLDELTWAARAQYRARPRPKVDMT